MKNIKTLFAVILISVLFNGCAEHKEKGSAGEESEKMSFALPSVSGAGTIDINSFAGKPVMVFFWSANCGYCIQAMPYLESLYKKYGAKGFVVLGVNVDPPGTPVEEYLKESKISFPVVVDRGAALFRDLGLRGIPAIFLLKKDLTLHNKW